MKAILAAAAAASLLALSAPAFAQNANSPGAAGVTGGASGSNTGSGPVTTNDAVTPSDRSGTVGEGRAAAPDATTNGNPSVSGHSGMNGDANGNNMSRSNGQ